VTAMTQIDTLKSHFAFLAKSQGFISEKDYHTACHSITSTVVLNALADWLVEKGYKLVKGVGPQYQKELMQRVKNPNVRDVKDTKHRTHKNPNKFQKSKKTNDEHSEVAVPAVQDTSSFHLKKADEESLYNAIKVDSLYHELFMQLAQDSYYELGHVPSSNDLEAKFAEAVHQALPKIKRTYIEEFGRDPGWGILDISDTTKQLVEDALYYLSDEFDESHWSPERASSFHLNKVIEELQEFEDEFLPAWKKWKASLAGNTEFIALLASLGLTAQDFTNYDQAQRSIMQLVEAYGNQIPEDAYINHTALQNEFLKIDPNAKLPINQRITNAISKIFDPKVLAEIFTALYSGIQSGFDTRELTPGEEPSTPAEAMPSGTRDLEFTDMGGPALETASKRAAFARRASLAKISTTVARVGYAKNERMRVKFDNGVSFFSYIAETPLQKAAGLEVFESLAATDGLLFPFEESGSVTFHMGSVQFPIDIVFLMDAPNGLEVGKIIANIQPGSPEWWTHSNTLAVLEVAGGMCKKANIKVGSICRATTHVEAQALPPEYSLTLPSYAGEFDIFDLFEMLGEYHNGQGDPIYAVQSRQSRHNISLDEMDAIESLLEDIAEGAYIPGYPHGQLAPEDAPMGIQEEEEYGEEGDRALIDVDIAKSWLPVIKRIIISEKSHEEEEKEFEIYETYE